MPAGRPPHKPCTYQGCPSPCAKGARFCGRHCGAVLAALRASRDYLTYDAPRHLRGELAEAAYSQARNEN